MIKNIAITIIATFVISMGITTVQMAHAAGNPELLDAEFNVSEILKLPGDDQATKYFNDEDGNSPIVSFVLTILNYFIAIMGSIAVILFIVTGGMFMISQGNQQKIDEAKDMFKYVLIGLLVTFLSYIIVIFVQSIFLS